MTPPLLTDEAERFWDRVLIGDDCWEFQGAKHRKGYGWLGFRGKNRPASQVAWELWHGRHARDGYWVLHHCDNPPCCRPDHLYEGTPSDNMRDLIERGRHHNTKKTHCPQGHPYDEENTAYYQAKDRKRPQRICKICRRAVWQRANAKRRKPR